jgi:hypothetical protein
MDTEELVRVIYAELQRQALNPRPEDDDGGWGTDVGFLGKDGVVTFEGKIDLIALAKAIKGGRNVVLP